MDWKKGLLIVGGLGLGSILVSKFIEKASGTPATPVTQTTPATPAPSVTPMPSVVRSVDSTNPKVTVNKTGQLVYNNNTIPPITDQPIGSTPGSFASYKINGQAVTQTFYENWKKSNGLA